MRRSTSQSLILVYVASCSQGQCISLPTLLSLSTGTRPSSKTQPGSTEVFAILETSDYFIVVVFGLVLRLAIHVVSGNPAQNARQEIVP